jgi:hypothetical protein
MFYLPEMTKKPRWQELVDLPYVTMTENAEGRQENYYRQWKTEKRCLKQRKFAANYDWAMIADIDEYLWFPQNVGIKDFLKKQQEQNMTYLSFGKQMYTLDHRTDLQAMNYKVNTTQSGFALSRYPFFLKYFCYGKRKGHPMCPTWKGRAKVIVKPKFHQKVDVHGLYLMPKLETMDDAKHFHPDEAHFMEWPHIFSPHNVTQREPVPFRVAAEEEVSIHNLKNAFRSDEDGKFTLQYDNKLQDWFRFVLARAEHGLEER